MSRVIVPLLAVAPARLTARTRPGWDGPSTQAFTDCREKSSGISIRVAADCLSEGEKLRESRNAHPVFSSRNERMADLYSICSELSMIAFAYQQASIEPILPWRRYHDDTVVPAQAGTHHLRCIAQRAARRWAPACAGATAGKRPLPPISAIERAECDPGKRTSAVEITVVGDQTEAGIAYV